MTRDPDERTLGAWLVEQIRDQIRGHRVLLALVLLHVALWLWAPGRFILLVPRQYRLTAPDAGASLDLMIVGAAALIYVASGGITLDDARGREWTRWDGLRTSNAENAVLGSIGHGLAWLALVGMTVLAVIGPT